MHGAPPRLSRVEAFPRALPALAERPASTVRRWAPDYQHDDQCSGLRRRHAAAGLHTGIDRHDSSVEDQAMSEQAHSEGADFHRRGVIQAAGLAMVGGLLTAASTPADAASVP